MRGGEKRQRAVELRSGDGIKGKTNGEIRGTRERKAVRGGVREGDGGRERERKIDKEREKEGERGLGREGDRFRESNIVHWRRYLPQYDLAGHVLTTTCCVGWLMSI